LIVCSSSRHTNCIVTDHLLAHFLIPSLSFAIFLSHTLPLPFNYNSINIIQVVFHVDHSKVTWELLPPPTFLFSFRSFLLSAQLTLLSPYSSNKPLSHIGRVPRGPQQSHVGAPCPRDPRHHVGRALPQIPGRGHVQRRGQRRHVHGRDRPQAGVHALEIFRAVGGQGGEGRGGMCSIIDAAVCFSRGCCEGFRSFTTTKFISLGSLTRTSTAYNQCVFHTYQQPDVPYPDMVRGSLTPAKHIANNLCSCN
jgi:hypothetical protein